MNKQEIYEFLNARGITYDVVEHPAAFTVDDIAALQLPEEESWAKNLFLRDDKKRNFYLLVLPDFKRANLRAFQEAIGSRRLHFAPEHELTRYLKVPGGSVTPLAALNDDDCVVQVYIDAYFRDRRIAVHPNENTASVYMNANDLVDILREHGSPVSFVDPD